MSGDWAKVELNTPDKPEIWAIANELGIDPDAAFGKVFRVWAWFDEHTEDGNAPSVTKMLLDRQVGVTGFCDSLLHVGWMVENEGIVTLPNFDKHNGNTAKKRANTNARVAKHRATTSPSKCNVPSVTKSVTREEKRREDIKDISAQKKSPLSYSAWPSLPDDQKLKDWKQVRRSKKAPITQTALNAIGKELTKAQTLGFTVNQCFEQMISSSWQGFKAEWMTNSKQLPTQQTRTTQGAMPKAGSEK